MTTLSILLFPKLILLVLLLFISTWALLATDAILAFDSNRHLLFLRPCPSEESKTWRVVVTSNGAFEKELLNWYYHFEKSGMMDGSTTEAVLYAEDESVYEKYKNSSKVVVKKAWDTRTRFKDVDLTKSDKFVIGQSGFNELVSRRPAILLNELELDGPNVLYMDLDVILLRDPRPLFLGDYDFWAAKADNTAQKTSERWVFNSGFLALRPTIGTLEFLARWQGELEKPKEPGKNQGPFNHVITQMERENRLQVSLLLDRVFPVGRKWRDDARRAQTSDLEIEKEGQMALRKLPRDVVAFHNNFCSTYKDCKIDRAKALGIWMEMDTSALL